MGNSQQSLGSTVSELIKWMMKAPKALFCATCSNVTQMLRIRTCKKISD